MAVKQIRKQNFVAILAEFERDQRAKGLRPTLINFGERYGLNYRHVSQMKNGSRDIGDAVARRIEQNHIPKLPDGWMDIQHGPGVPKDKAEAEIVEIVLDLYRDNPALVYRIINNMLKEK